LLQSNPLGQVLLADRPSPWQRPSHRFGTLYRPTTSRARTVEEERFSWLTPNCPSFSVRTPRRRSSPASGCGLIMGSANIRSLDGRIREDRWPRNGISESSRRFGRASGSAQTTSCQVAMGPCSEQAPR